MRKFHRSTHLPAAESPTTLQRPARGQFRQGVAALIALVCLSLATVIGTLLLQASLSEQAYLNRLEMKAQGDWLVEAGFCRARAQLAKSSRYTGETWAVPGTAFGRTQNAIVTIAATGDSANAGPRHVAIAVTFSALNEPAIEASRDLSTR
jgi:hypothetical protein